MFPEREVWRVVKDTRTAVLKLRAHPLGHELRASVDDRFLWSQVVGPAELAAVSTEHLEAWKAKGWRLADADTEPQ